MLRSKQREAPLGGEGGTTPLGPVSAQRPARHLRRWAAIREAGASRYCLRNGSEEAIASYSTGWQ